MKSLGMEVEILTVETCPVDAAVAGIPAFGSKGLAVFAPDMPHAITVVPDCPEAVSVMTFEDRTALAIA